MVLTVDAVCFQVNYFEITLVLEDSMRCLQVRTIECFRNTSQSLLVSFLKIS